MELAVTLEWAGPQYKRTGDLIQRGNLDTDSQAQGERHVTMEAETK